MPKPKTDLERWTAEAKALPSDELRINLPLHVLTGEADDLAKFYETYHATVPAKGNDPERPGLDSVADERKGLHPTTADDLRSLALAVDEADSAYVQAASPTSAAPMGKARFLVGEMASTLEFLFDDGVEDERDAQLDTVERAHQNTPESADAAAAELQAYADLAHHYRTEIDGLGGFKLSYIDDAKQLAAELRARPPVPGQLSEEAAKALALRNRVATLLQTRMGFVRAAARFVFRHHPAISRQATSAYDRRRRAAARRKAEAKKKEPK